VSDSYTLFVDETPKFAKRAQYLTDLLGKAQTLQNISQQGNTALNNFLAGPAATLANGVTAQATKVSTLPNTVIYGWQDNPPKGGAGGCTDPTSHNRVGCVHIVKVTAKSVGHGAATRLPWIKTTTKSFLGIPYSRSYTLTDRDGRVSVRVKRWDEDHDPILFPNGRPLWQFLFHAPGQPGTVGEDVMDSCRGVSLPGCSGSNCYLGFGLLSNTAGGLSFQKISSNDKRAFANAFMIDGTALDTEGAASGSYISCLDRANQLLGYGMQSYACADYIASLNAAGASQNGDQDYSVKFVGANCSPPSDSF
jgi:hypothetical protein